VAAAVAPDAVAGKIGGDEDGLARVGDDAVDLGHVGGERADLLGREVIEDGVQILGQLPAVPNGKYREQCTKNRQEQVEHVERRAVAQVAVVAVDEGASEPCLRWRHAAMLAAAARKPDVGAGGPGETKWGWSGGEGARVRPAG